MVGAIRPLYDRVLVQRIENEGVTAGGLIIPDTAQEKTQYGTVVSVGEGKLSAEGSLRPLTVKGGDKVLFGKYAGTEIKLDGKEFLILREDELLGVFDSK